MGDGAIGRASRRARTLAFAVLAAAACAAGATTGCTTEPAAEGIDFYQRFLGDQWAFHCDFQPSCSNYGKQAVARFGSLPGSLMIADRLMRDHDLAYEEYARDEQGRPLDPPSDNALFGPRAEAWSDEALAVQAARDAVEIERAPPAADLDEAELLRFADSLFRAADFERARIEYLRLLHHRPQTPHATRCHERIAFCLAKAKRAHDALAEAERIPEPAERERTRALVLRELGRPAEALAAAEPGAGPLLCGFLALETGQADRARGHFSQLDGELRTGLLARADELEQLPTKSRWLAGSLSAVLPGSGQLYAGRPADGGVAFLTNAILIGGTVAAARRDQNVAAAAIGFVAFGFYAGNVYGAVNAAAKHDRAGREGVATRARGWARQSGLLGWSLSVTPEGDGGALGIYFGF